MLMNKRPSTRSRFDPVDRHSKRTSISKHIQFHIDTVTTFPPVICTSKALRAYVHVRASDRKDRLKTGMNEPHTNPASWKEDLDPVVLKDTSRITFELKHRPARWRPGSSHLAITETYSVGELLGMQQNRGKTHIVLPLCALGSKSGPRVKIGDLRMSIAVLSSLEAATFFVDRARRGAHEFQAKSTTLSSRHATIYGSGYDVVLKPICGILDIVGPFIALSPEPICSAVVGIVHGTAKSLKEQIEQDTDVMSLVKKIHEIYSTVESATGLHTQRPTVSFEEALRELVTTIGDCTQFMLEFFKYSLLGRVARTPQQAKRLASLQARLDKSHEDVHRGVVLIAATSSTNNAHGVAIFNARRTLYARAEIGPNELPRCRGGELAAPLAYIKSWATSPLTDGKNVFWLHGPAGCGKSKVVATFFDHSLDHCIGGNLFFEKNNKDPAFAIQTLAAQLGLQFLSTHEALSSAITGSMRPNLKIMSRSLEAQFEALILQPLLAHVPDSPLVFLVDGIEWCGYDQDTGTTCSKQQEVLSKVLRVLVEGSARFPPHVRLLISSRENGSVRELFEGCPRVAELEMEAAVDPKSLGGWRDGI
ncbi:hypothetical protein DFH07DRAFT_853773 [Mycena maculata]|uniref:Nephrocystin 3-like N-terminal domain-containing protein n=1 Tax=Mycena maculata TaxID=230809 RepID=A0AAD7MNJ7_9AGAR|nr:hypothetical protein DFH07DRAFT_853773 [Mycena maculata]